MPTMQVVTRTAAALAMLLLVAPAHGVNVNKSINIEAGSQSGARSTVSGSITVGRAATVTGGLETVNGSIRIDEDARIREVETVNGSLRVADGASSGDLSTVNGRISLGERVRVEGSVGAVNGGIDIGTGTTVSEDVGNVNGEITIEGAELGGDLETVNGDVALHGESVVAGDLVVKKSRGASWFSRPPRVVIGPGSRVEGTVRLEREVELYISDSAEVGGVTGVMSLEDAVRFSGDRP